jgi:hypothetical protein
MKTETGYLSEMSMKFHQIACDSKQRRTHYVLFNSVAVEELILCTFYRFVTMHTDNITAVLPTQTYLMSTYHVAITLQLCMPRY